MPTLPMQQAWPTTRRRGGLDTEVVARVNNVLLTHKCFS